MRVAVSRSRSHRCMRDAMPVVIRVVLSSCVCAVCVCKCRWIDVWVRGEMCMEVQMLVLAVDTGETGIAAQ